MSNTENEKRVCHDFNLNYLYSQRIYKITVHYNLKFKSNTVFEFICSNNIF